MIFLKGISNIYDKMLWDEAEPLPPPWIKSLVPFSKKIAFDYQLVWESIKAVKNFRIIKV